LLPCVGRQLDGASGSASVTILFLLLIPKTGSRVFPVAPRSLLIWFLVESLFRERIPFESSVVDLGL